MREFSEQQNGQRVEISCGEIFQIALDENPTTGFRWHFAPDTDPKCVLAEDSFTPVAKKTGAGGKHRWQFQAMKTGEDKIEFVHRRSWENDSSRSPRLTFFVIVREAAP